MRARSGPRAGRADRDMSVSVRIGTSVARDGGSATMNSGVRLEAGLRARLVLYGDAGGPLAAAAFRLEPAPGPRSPPVGKLRFSLRLPEGERVATTLYAASVPHDAIRYAVLFLSNDGAAWRAYDTGDSDVAGLAHALTRLDEGNRVARLLFVEREAAGGGAQGGIRDLGDRVLRRIRHPAQDALELEVRPVPEGGRPGAGAALAGFRDGVALTAHGWTGPSSLIPRSPPLKRASWEGGLGASPGRRDLGAELAFA